MTKHDENSPCIDKDEQELCEWAYDGVEVCWTCATCGCVDINREPPSQEWSERAYRRCPDGDRPTNEPGGMECMECQCIFIGAEWHSRCAICEERRKEQEAHDRAAYRFFTGKP